MTPKEFKKNRKKIAFTQKALAYELGTHPNNICQFEKGITSFLSRKSINTFKLLLVDSAFMKASRNIKSMVIDKNMFGVTYEDV